MEAEPWGRKIKTGSESLAVKEREQNHSGELQGYARGTAVHLLLLLTHTLMTVVVVPFLLFSRVQQLYFEWQPISPKSPLQQFPLQQAHGKAQSSSGDFVNPGCSRCYCRGGDSPTGGMKRSKKKIET